MVNFQFYKIKAFLKFTWFALTMVVVIISLYMRFSGILFIGFRSMIFVMLLGMFPFIKNDIFRLVAFLICIIGIYDFFFLSVKSAEPTIFEFTFPVSYFLIREGTGSFFRWLLKVFPLLFYLTTFYILLVRRIKGSFGPTIRC